MGTTRDLIRAAAQKEQARNGLASSNAKENTAKAASTLPQTTASVRPATSDPLWYAIEKTLNERNRSSSPLSRAVNTLTGSVSSSGAGLVNAVGVGSSAVFNPDRNRTYIERLKSGLASGKTADGTVLTPGMRKSIEQDIARLESEISRWESTGNLTDRIYDVADTLRAAGEADLQTAKAGLGTAGQFAVDLGAGAVQLAGQMAASAIPGGGLALLAAESFGGSAQDARRAGATLTDQVAYGAGSAAVSALTERLSNIAGPFKKAFGNGILDKALNKMTAKPMGKLAVSAISEALEEGAESLAQPILQKLTFNPEAQYDADWWADTLYSMAIGGALGGAGGGLDLFVSRGAKNAAANGAGAQTVSAEGKLTPATQNASVGVSGAEETSAPLQEDVKDATMKDADPRILKVREMKAAGAPNSRIMNETGLIVMANGNIQDGIGGPIIGSVSDGNGSNRYNVSGDVAVSGGRTGAVQGNDGRGYRGQSVGDLRGSGTDSPRAKFNTLSGPQQSAVIDAIKRHIMQNGMTPEVAMLTAGAGGLDNFAKQFYGMYEFGRASAEEWSAMIPDVDGLVDALDIMTGHGSVGAADAGFDPYSQLQNQSSQFYPEGANAARPVEVPTEDFGGRKVSQAASTVMGAEAIPDAMIPTVEQMVAAGLLSHDVVTDKSSMERAEATIREAGWDGAMERLRIATRNGYVSKDMTVLAERMLVNAANARDGKSMAELLALYQTMRTNTGQAMQAGTLLRKMSPEWQLYAIQKTVSNLQSDLNQKRGGQDTELKIDEGLLEKFMEQTDQEGRDAVMQEIYQQVAAQVPSNWRDKWNAWRYLSMLGNPRTHIRNTAGNVGFQPVRVVKNEIAAVLEHLFGVKEKTKAFTVSPALYRAAWNDFSNVKELTGGNRYESNTGKIMQEREIFETKLLESLRRGNSKALELEDLLFKRITYADSLAQYLKANGVKAEQVESGTVSGELMSRARTYAAQEALKATYQDSNAISNKTEEIAKTLGAFGEAVMPFKRTPANILSRALEYSPAGLVKSLTADLAKVRRGDMTAAQAIDNIAAGLTGTGLFALGAYLFANGMVTGAQGDDEEGKWQELLGHQGYALELDDGTSVTLDWLAPESLPFFMGVEFMSSVGENGFQMDDMVDTLNGVAEPMLEMSMLQSVNDLLDSVSYADSSKKLGAMVASALISYFSQAVPTIGGQLERIGETERTSTYTDKNKALPTDLQYAIGKASAKIPGWDYGQIPYIDAWGRQEETGDLLERAANNLFNPAYISQVDVDSVEQELQRLYDSVGNEYGTVFPQRAARSFVVDEETKNLTAEEYVKYAKAKGENSYKFAKQVMALPAYKQMTDSEKAELIADVYAYANYKAKQTVDSGYKHDTYDTYAEAEKQGITPAEYAAYRLTKNDIKADKDKGSKQEKVINYIDSLNLSGPEKDWLFLLSYASENEKTNKEKLRDLPWNK